MEQDIMQQAISAFLDRFHPNGERELATLREIQQALAAGNSLESLYPLFLSLGDGQLLRSFYQSIPSLRNDILSHPNCPADLQQSVLRRHPLLTLDFEIELDLKGLADYQASLPDGSIEGTAKAGCESRIQNLKRLFDRVPAVLHETDLTNNDDPLFYDLLMAKQRISTNQKFFTKLRIGLLNRFAKPDPDREQAHERSLLDETPRSQPQEKSQAEEQSTEQPQDDLNEELLSALQAEEEAQAKAEKKAANAKRQKQLQQQAKAQEERSIHEQRQREERSRSSDYAPVYSDQAEVLRRQEERNRDEVLQQDAYRQAETRSIQQENLQSYQERMERSRGYESFGTSHIDFSGHEQTPTPESYHEPASPEIPNQQPEGYRDQNASPRTTYQEPSQGVPPSTEYTHGSESLGSSHVEQKTNYDAALKEVPYSSEAYRQQEERRREEILRAEAYRQAEQRSTQPEHQQNNPQRAEYNRDSESFGPNRIEPTPTYDASPKEAAYSSEVYRQQEERRQEESLRAEAYRQAEQQQNDPQRVEYNRDSESFGPSCIEPTPTYDASPMEVPYPSDTNRQQEEYRREETLRAESYRQAEDRSAQPKYHPADAQPVERIPRFESLGGSDADRGGVTPINQGPDRFESPRSPEPYTTYEGSGHQPQYDNRQQVIPNREFADTRQGEQPVFKPTSYSSRYSPNPSYAGQPYSTHEEYVRARTADESEPSRSRQSSPVSRPAHQENAAEFQPYAYAPGGTVRPLYDTHQATIQQPSNPELYRAISSSGTITPEQSRAMRDNLINLRNECSRTEGTADYADAARRYQEARQAIIAVNRDVKANQVTFDHGAAPATNSANVIPTRRWEQPDGFTNYRYTPTGVIGTPDQSNSVGGGVVVHNAPGTAGKTLPSPEHPMLVTKAYEEALYRDAQLAKSQLEQRMKTTDSSGATTKLSVAELSAYKTAMDAYEGFHRAKADGLVQISSQPGAYNTPDPFAWAARQETYRKTAEYQQYRQQRTENGPTPRSNDQKQGTDRANKNDRRYDPRNDWQSDWEAWKRTPDPRRKGSNDQDQDEPKKRKGNNDQDQDEPKKRKGNNDQGQDEFKGRGRDDQNNSNNDFDPHPRKWRDRWNFNWHGAPFGSVFSINYYRSRYTAGEREAGSSLFKQDSKLQRVGTMRNMGDRLYQTYAMRAPEASRLAVRKFYTMLQASGESASQSIRTFEEGRYYGAVGAGVALAYTTRNVGNLNRFERQVARAERHQFGFVREVSNQDISKQLHTKMNQSRAAKKEIRGMYEREAGLSVEERRILAEKLKNHKAMGKETNHLSSLQEARFKEKVQRELLQELHRNPAGQGLLTEKALNDLKAQRQQIHVQRRAILNSQPDRAELNKRLAELKKKGTLSAHEKAELTEIQDKLRRLSNDPRLKALDRQEQDILKLLKKKPDETAVGLKKIRLKDVKKLRAKVLEDHAKLENGEFVRFKGVKTSAIEANKKRLEQQSELAKRKVKALASKSNLSAAEKVELQNLRNLLKNNQSDLKAHADILKLRKLRDTKIEELDKLRKTLQKNKQRTRMGKMALVSLLTKPLNEGDSTGAQGLSKGISIGINPYVRSLVEKSMHATSFVVKKVGKVTGLDKTFAPAIEKVQKTYAGVRKLAATPREYQRKLIKTAVNATKRAASRMTPQFIKTGHAAVRKAMTDLARRLQQSKLGKAYESIARALSKVKALLGTVMKAITAFLAKFLLVFLIIFLLVGLITVIGGGVGGSLPSFLIMGDEEEDDRIDLEPYYDIIVDEWEIYLEDLKDKKSEGYYKVIVNMDPQPANVRNILSMMAVRMSQNLDPDENSDIEPYLRSLTRSANPYTTNVTTCYCTGRNCQTYGHNDDCPVRCTSSHAYCPGDHEILTMTITPLYFNEIFYADTSGNANANIESGELIGYFKITHYCLENYPHICNDGDSSTTASGTKPKANYTIATDPSVIETGTPVVIDGKTYMAEDTGGAIKGNRIDIAVSTHAEALRLGTRENVPVYAGEYKGEGIQTSDEWNGWVAENREWAKAIYSAPWNELYSGIPNVTDTVGNETDLSGVNFVDGTRAGNQAIVDCAMSQLGNTGGQPYWSWYGFDSRVEWCATFVSWCANQQGVLGTAIPKFCSCSLEGVPWFQKHDQWASADSGYVPVAGDIIFFDWQEDGRPDHVGIVVGSDGIKVYTVEGNSSDAVRTKVYSLTSGVLFGYGLPNY